MISRTALVPEGSLGALSAFRQISAKITEICDTCSLGGTPIDVDVLFAGTMVQAGVNKFLVSDSHPDGLGSSEFMCQRTDTIRTKYISDLYRAMATVIESQTVRTSTDYDRDPHLLAGLLADLVLAARYRTSLILAMPLPDIEVFRDKLRPEFYAAIEVFFSGLECGVANMPVPQSAVSATDINCLHSILKSDLFSDYRDAQSVVDNARNSLPDQVKNISSTARSLTRGFSDHITLQKIVLSGLSITNFGVELLFGKLPSAAMSPLKQIFQSHFVDDHRVVLYDFHSVWWRAFEQQMRPVVEAVKRERAGAPSHCDLQAPGDDADLLGSA